MNDIVGFLLRSDVMSTLVACEAAYFARMLIFCRGSFGKYFLLLLGVALICASYIIYEQEQFSSGLIIASYIFSVAASFLIPLRANFLQVVFPKTIKDTLVVGLQLIVIFAIIVAGIAILR